MASDRTGSYRPNLNSTSGRDMALVCEYMVHAMKKNSQQQMLAGLPGDVRKRIRALRKLQLETTTLEAEFHRLVYELEQKHQQSYDALFKKRRDIISGTYEPSAEECDYPDPVDELANSSDNFVTETPTASDPKDTNAAPSKVNGVPDFWLNIFKYVPMFELIVKECDEPVLKHLTDIKVSIAPLPEMFFTLEFYFSPNDYFNDAILTKMYLMKCELDATVPFSFDGPEIYNCRGCEIHWKDGKDLTKRTMVHKTGLESPPKTLKSDTFFNFFSPPALPENVDDKEYDTNNGILETDFEIGHYLKERIVPRAVLYFTGEDDDDFDSEDSLTSDSADYAGSEDGDDDIEAAPTIGDGEH